MTENDFVSFRVGAVDGISINQKIADALSSLRDIDDLFSLPGAIILKNSRTTKAAAVEIEVVGEKKKFHVKRLNNRGLFYTLRYFLSSSRAKRIFWTSLESAKRGVALPKACAFLEERSAGVLKRSFFITEFVSDAKILPEAWKIAARSERLVLIKSLARFIADVHNKGFFQRDMKASNILVGKKQNDFKFFVTDLDGAKLFDKIGRQHRVRDLARLSASMLFDATAADRLRFLYEYFDAADISHNASVGFTRGILLESVRIVRRQLSKKKHNAEVEKLLKRFLMFYTDN